MKFATDAVLFQNAVPKEHTYRVSLERGIRLRDRTIHDFGWERQFTPKLTRDCLWEVEAWENGRFYVNLKRWRGIDGLL